MTQVIGDATHIKGKPLSGSPSSGDTWVFDGTQYVLQSGVPPEDYRMLDIHGTVLTPGHVTDTLYLSGMSGVKLTALSGAGSGQDGILFEVSGLSSGQIPNWSAISGMADYSSGIVHDVSGLSGFVMASGDGLVVTVPSPVSGRILRASGSNILTDLYWGIDQTGSGSGLGNAYAYIFVHGTTLDANAPDDTLSLSGRSGVLLTAVSGALQGEDVIFVEVSGLSSGQIPNWADISGMADYASGKLDDADGLSGLVLASGNGLAVIQAVPMSGQVLRWSGSDLFADAHFDAAPTLSDIVRLQNSFIMIAWDVYSEDTTFSDVAVDDFETQSGVDSGQTVAVYDSGGSYYSRIPASSGNSGQCDIQSGDDIAVKDLRDIITHWQQEGSGASGRFSGSGGSGISIGPNGVVPAVDEGCIVRLPDGDFTIVKITNSGDGIGEVVLSSAHSGAAVSRISGLKVDSGRLQVNRDYVYSIPLNETMSDAWNDKEDWSFRIAIPSSVFDMNGAEVRVRVQGPGSESSLLHHVAIVERASGPNGTAVPTELLFSGSGGCEVLPGETRFSDWSVFTIDKTKDYLLIGDVGSNSAKDRFRKKTVAGYTAYSRSGTDSYNTSGFPSGYSTDTDALLAFNKLEVRALRTPPGLYAAHTVSGSRVDTSGWSHIESVVPVQSGSGAVYHAVSFDEGTTFKVYKNSQWIDIARLSGAQWQYNNDSSGTWASGASNDLLTVLASGFAVSGNQWNAAQMSGMSSADWESQSGTGGFVPGTVQSLDFAVGMSAASGGAVPALDKYVITYSHAGEDIVLVLSAWEASENDPNDAYCVLDIGPVDEITLDTDLRAYVSMDDGANYEQISGLARFRQIEEHDFVRGDISGLTPRSDKTMRLKITSHNGKDMRIHAAALGVSYT